MAGCHHSHEDVHRKKAHDKNLSCFLCLRNIFTLDPLIFQDKHNNINKRVSPAHTIIKIERDIIDDHDPKKISLQSIFRYLRVNLKHYNICSGNGENLRGLGKASDLSVTLCPHCYGIIAPLSALCIELEVLQMKVDHRLKSVCAQLEKSETDGIHFDSAQFQNLTQSATEQIVDNQLELTKVLRMELRKKCKVKLDQAVPKVKLVKTPSMLPHPDIGICGNISNTETVENAMPDSIPLEPRLNSLETESVASDPLSHIVSGPQYKARCEICGKGFWHRYNIKRHKKLVHGQESPVLKKRKSKVNPTVPKERLVKNSSPLSLSKTPCTKIKSSDNIMPPGDPPIETHKPSSKDGAVERKPKSKLFKNDQRHRFLKCNICNQKVLRSETLERHKKIAHGVESRVLKCDICRRGFFHASTLERHKREKHSNDATPSKCEICEKEFQFFCSLQRHRKMKHGLGAPLSKCDLCPQVFFHAAALSKHKKETHSALKCKICNKNFHRRCKLLQHKYLVHGEGTPLLKCNLCPEMFVHAFNVEKHKRQQHSNDASALKCDLCQKTFFYASKLLNHKNKYHPNGGNSTPKCELCGKEFKYNRCLWRHKKARHGDGDSKPVIKCDLCCQIFVHEDNLLKHKKDKHANVLKCNDCEHFFYRACDLLKHTLELHPLPNGASYPKCETCGKVFLRKESLWRHNTTKHGQGGPGLNCNICGQHYRQASSLLKHQKEKHADGRAPVPECKICGKVFKRKSSMYRHKTEKHGGGAKWSTAIPEKTAKDLKSASHSDKLPTSTSIHLSPVVASKKEIHLFENVGAQSGHPSKDTVSGSNQMQEHDDQLNTGILKPPAVIDDFGNRCDDFFEAEMKIVIN